MIRKIFVSLFSIFVLIFFSINTFADVPQKNSAITKNIFQLSNAKIITTPESIVIYNKTNQPINMQNAWLQFYFPGNIHSVSHNKTTIIQPSVILKASAPMNHPNNPGSLYKIQFSQAAFILNPGKSLQLTIHADTRATPTGVQLYTSTLVPVAVTVKVLNADWTQTIQICNTSGNTIPLKDVTFSFNFGKTINAIWGNPWLAWEMTSHQGTQYTLHGGTAWTPDLKSDPTCATPITIQFSSTPDTAVPTGPFVFTATGATPTGAGTLAITLPAAPATGLPNPTISVNGMGITTERAVTWGQNWTLPNLAPGAYTVSANPVNNGQSYYQAAPVTVTVQNQTTANAKLTYTTVATTAVNVTLVNAPAGSQTINFKGTNYNFDKSLSSGSTVALPADTYTISANSAGYTVTASPNPITVPQQKSVTLTYTKGVTVKAGFGGYFQSWSSKWASDPAKTDIANIAPYVTYVYVSFMRPDNTYQKGSMSFSGTGIDLNYQDGNVFKQAVALLRQKNPNTKVLISVGGATYNNWPQYNAKGVADFVADFGLDGIDIDYEAANPGCVKGADGLIRCQIDAAFQNIITSTRVLIPRPYLLTAATWSIAAYGQDKWSNAQPVGEFTGMMLPFFRSTAAKDLDIVNVMSYDASNAYNPIEALAAYSHYFKGIISMGIEVPPEAWGGHVYTLAEVQQLAQAVLTTASQTGSAPNMMMWSLQKQPTGTPSSTNPSAQMMATTVCNVLGLTNCTAPLFSQ